MASRAQDNSRIVSVRLPDDLIRRLDRYLDWRETSGRVKFSRNAALREALRLWLDDQEHSWPGSSPLRPCVGSSGPPTTKSSQATPGPLSPAFANNFSGPRSASIPS
jgi:hypothetical protein